LELCEAELPLRAGPVPKRISDLHVEGIRRSKRVDCFSYVPSSSCLLFAVLSCIRPGRYCEWGSGVGIGIGIAESLGFEATGIEVDGPLAEQSRALLADFDFSSKIITGSFFDLHIDADVYFTYSWPSKMPQVESCFLHYAPDHAHLIYGAGADEFRCQTKRHIA
jgi:hypothetical protein